MIPLGAEVFSIDDVEYYITGSKILGCGGGGSESKARERIKSVYGSGGEFTIVPLQDVPDDKLVFIVGAVGGGVSQDIRRSVAGLERVPQDTLVLAAERMIAATGMEPFGLIASEIGPGNGVAPMYVAARLGLVTVDGDCCGRAKPEIAISTTNLAGLSITPMSMVSPFGDVMVLEEAVDDKRAESIARQCAVASGGSISVARCPASGSDYKRAAIEGSVSRSVELGTAVHRARDRGDDPVDAIVECESGYRLFSGKIRKSVRVDAGGFVTGDVFIEGQPGLDRNRESEMRVWYKNEYLCSWIDETPHVTSPDLICIVDANTGEGLTPWKNQLTQGRRVEVVGISNDPRWRGERGLSLFGPEHFGFDIEYTPIEELVEGQ
ncbi:DUF917 domain-containing protein [Candidatus Thorarchaeota archaeon]|nr:MAG: DUF917 domain-containing protein [Candidatus Thorarchaeota archaeon]